MLIEKKNTADLLPADYNPRKDLKPGDAEYEKLKRSIEQFGYVEPVIWNKATGRVVGGHQRLKVLIDLGMTEVDCVVVLRRLIKSILVCNGNVLIFRFFDGTEITRIWKDRSRSQSWTDEMKATARQKALERRNLNA